MKISVKFQEPYSIVIGKEKDTLTLPDGATVADLRAALRSITVKNSSFKAMIDYAMFSVGKDVLPDNAPLSDSEEILVSSAFMGG